jgi:hypothetical protein
MSQIVQISSGAGTPVSNTTTMTSFAKWSIPADSLKAGKIYRISGAIRSTGGGGSSLSRGPILPARGRGWSRPIWPRSS